MANRRMSLNVYWDGQLVIDENGLKYIGGRKKLIAIRSDSTYTSFETRMYRLVNCTREEFRLKFTLRCPTVGNDYLAQEIVDDESLEGMIVLFENFGCMSVSVYIEKELHPSANFEPQGYYTRMPHNYINVGPSANTMGDQNIPSEDGVRMTRKNQMSEAEEEDAIGGTCEWDEEDEILVGSEVASRENGIGSFVPRGGCSRIRMDMNNSYLPPFSDDIALLILARLPSSKCYDLCLVNRRFRSLIRSGELNEIGKKIGLKKPKVFFFSKGPRCYGFWSYEPFISSCWDLPKCPINAYLIEKSFCVGTHVFISRIITGKNSHSNIWRYELELNRWFNGPTMITPRCNFASADCGSVACVAGGMRQVSKKVLNSAEKYNPESKSWEPLLSSMNRRRKYCTGFYMDSKFYVIGGRNENDDLLTCGECYDFERNVWELIPNMLENNLFSAYTAHKLKYFIGVVNNELYYFDFPSNCLMVYLKNKNTWKKVGSAPASFKKKKNSAVALKSLGNELLLIGKLYTTVLCFCTPSPDLDDVKWHGRDFICLSGYDKNCCVMMV